MEIAQAVNTLGAFCGVRDVKRLDPMALQAEFGMDRADVMVLFGGSILYGGDVFAHAIQADVARKYVIVGGAGHTTSTLRSKLHAAFPAIEADGRPEAELFNAYLQIRYGLRADLLETESTNCGNNITNMLKALDSHDIPCQSIILAQDATMQRRMAAGLRLHRPGWTIINYATYQAKVVECHGSLQYEDDIWGMWDIQHYIALLLGEIQRLRDDEGGYGPKGKGFIAHEKIPTNVEESFERLSAIYNPRCSV